MQYDWSLPYASRRAPVLARNVVATSQPLAAQAGIRMLLAGGNAVDAALATAIALAIVEPCSNGIGSDAFALVWDGSELHGLNASGRSPAGWTRERFAGREAMPGRGWDSVTVPGAVSAWAALSERFGALPFADLFQPAIEYASEGFPVGPFTAFAWRYAERTYREFPDFVSHFLPTGRAPKPGERFAAPEQRGARSRPTTWRRTAPSGSSRSARTIATCACTRSRRMARDSRR
jgi:gamma-glutamyltranspeptidase/glutathione hydrolase